MGNQSTLKKLRKDREETDSKSYYEGEFSPFVRKLASLTLALSGMLLYLDRAILYFGIEIELPKKFEDADYPIDVFIWLSSLSVSAILSIISCYFRPYLYAYLVPLFCWILQVHFILIGNNMVDDEYTKIYSGGITTLLVIIMFSAKKVDDRRTRKRLDRLKERAKRSIIDERGDKKN